MNDSKTETVVGVDLGGTKILSGVFNSSMERISTAKVTTKPQRGSKAVIERIIRCVKDSVDEADLTLKQIKAIGIGAAGSVDSNSGDIIFAPNLKWKNVPLKKELEKELGVPVFVTNDCRASMLGIYVTELKSKPRNVLGIFVGTGIGGGLILNGETYSGFNNTAGEIGHMVVDMNGPKCGCGNKGCIEAIASRTAIFRQIKTGVENGEKTILTEMLGGNLDEMKSGDLRKALRRGDKFVRGIIDEAASNIGVATANLINIFSPEVVVFGGGVIEALADEMMEIIEKTARDHALPGTLKDVQLIPSKLGDNAAITGGAVLARREAK